MKNFQHILTAAEQRKGGKQALEALLPTVLSTEALAALGDDRFLATMAKVINQAGFSWKVIEQKWSQFEDAFYGFDLKTLSGLTLDDWEVYREDTRVVRNWQKIKAVMMNVAFINREAAIHGSFARFIADWPSDDQIGLLDYLKKHGSRLGGNSGQWFLRFIGWDSFILTKDVCAALKSADVDIPDNPTRKSDLRLVQHAFNTWHRETGFPYTHLSRIAACSIGENYLAENMTMEPY